MTTNPYRRATKRRSLFAVKRYRSRPVLLVRGLGAAVLGVGLWASGCGSSQAVPDMSARFYSVHTAMQASGLTQMGAVSRGRLEATQSVKLPLELTSECLTVVAMGDQGVADLSLALVNSEGKEIARDDMIGPDASMRYCADQPGKHELLVVMAQGSGGYAVSTWSGGTPTRRAEASPQGPATVEGGGSCDAPTVIAAGQTYVGNTENGRKMEEGTCGNTSASELVYRLDLPSRQRVTIDVRAEYDAVLYVRRGECADPEAEVACNDDAPGGGRRSRVDEVLDAGTYFVFVDGYGEEEGAYRMTVQLRPTSSARNACDTAPVLALGSAVRGSMVDRVNNAAATCGNRGPGPDLPFRLDLASRSRVRISQRARGFAPVVHVRSACEQADSEVGCSSESMGASEATYAGVLEAGTHFVFADAATDAASGDFSLFVQAVDAAGGGGRGDTCGDAVSLASEAETLVGDTFEARDDVQVGCGTAGAPEVVYRVDLLRKARFIARMRKDEGKHHMALQPACGATATELGCGTDLDRVLQPGTYWLVVQSTARDSFGRFELGYRIDDLGAVENACAAAPVLGHNKGFTGNTQGARNLFFSPCMGPADVQSGGDRFHKITLTRRSKVGVTVSSDAFQAVLTLQRGCAEAEVLSCRYGHRPGVPVESEHTLDPGTYFVVVDAKEAGNEGEYTLSVKVQDAN